MKRCEGFCATECVTGYCPIALNRENDWYSDMGYDVPKSCKDCQYNTGRCEDCIFEESSEMYERRMGVNHYEKCC